MYTIHCAVIVGEKRVRDAVNARRIAHHSAELGEDVYVYHSRDSICRKMVSGEEQSALWRASSSMCDDALGKLPLFRGMKVMVRDNVAFAHKVVNGAEGIVERISYEVDEEGRRYAKVVYIRVEGAGKVCEDLPNDIVPIVADVTSFKLGKGKPTVSRIQVPLVPAYAYTDYKSQGRSLRRAIVDITSARSSQGIYVMLSRVTNLEGLLILRPFLTSKFPEDVRRDYKDELRRIDELDALTKERYEVRHRR